MKYPILFWILLVVAEACRHLFIIKRKKESPDKVYSFCLRAFLGALFILWEYYLRDRDLYVVIPAYIFAGWFLHDTILALGMGRKVWYLNNTGFLDRLQNNFGPYSWIFKAIAFATLTGMYFLNYPV